MDDATLTRIAFQRLSIIVCDPGGKPPTVAGVAAAAELAHLGIQVTNPQAVSDNLVDRWPDIYATVTALRGGDPHRYTPLFAGFPDRLPQWDNAKFRFTVAALRLLHVTVGADTTEVVTDADVRDALDFTGWGWWPASSVHQDPDLAAVQKAHQQMLPGDSRTEWICVRLADRFATDTALREWVAECCYSAASLRTEVLADVTLLLGEYGADGIDLDRVRFGEIRAAVTAAILASTPERIPALGLSPDDVLRMLAARAGGDVSLGSKLRVGPLPRPVRRAVLGALDASPRLGDMWRRRGLWLTVAKAVRAGDYSDRYPAAFAAITGLRETRRNHGSFMARFEYLAATDPAAAATLAAAEAPTVLVRNLRRFAHAPIAGIVERVDGVPLRTLLTARAVVADNGATYPRLAVNKRGRVFLLDTPNVAPAPNVAPLLDALDFTIGKTLGQFAPWDDATVWVDPALDGLLLPDQQRTTVDGLLNIDRGSRIPVPDANVLRLFMWWREPPGHTSDLDLSVVALDANYRQVSQVSWTNLGTVEMTHSGDITSAPDGAAEFIDIRLDQLDASGWTYLAPAILRYSGPAFGQLPEACAGWMLRDTPDSDRRTFDPKTVANAFRLNSRGGGTAHPFLYDIANRQIIYVDAYSTSMLRARTETLAGLPTLAAAAVGRARLRPSIGMLARLHADVRGATLVDTPEAASVTFGVGDGYTYDGYRPQKIVTELL